VGPRTARVVESGSESQGVSALYCTVLYCTALFLCSWSMSDASYPPAQLPCLNLTHPDNLYRSFPPSLFFLLSLYLSSLPTPYLSQTRVPVLPAVSRTCAGEIHSLCAAHRAFLPVIFLISLHQTVEIISFMSPLLPLFSSSFPSLVHCVCSLLDGLQS
jgi:hypothetical protein